MRKRIISSLLSLILLISAVTTMAIPVSAAPKMQTSWNGIAMIKAFEGFSKYPYWDNGQYTVGYGTRCPDADYSRYVANGITEAEAEKLFQSHLVKVEAAVNWFTNKHNLTLSQTKFDALVDFTYNCGSGWMTGNYKFRTAVLNGTTGKAFVDAIASWCTASGTVYSNLLTRRLCEANLYLNGIYGSTAKYFYSHVLYNAHGGSLSATGYQVFPVGTTADFRLTATRSGYEFQGWYTASTNGKKVTKLDSSLDGKTLHAYWNTAGSGTNTKPEQSITTVNYQCVVSVNNYLNIRKNPGSGSEAVGILANGATVTIVAETTADGVTWGKLSNGGWISLKYTQKSETGGDNKTTVTTRTAINIRSGAGTGYGMSGSLAPGKTVTITKISTDNQGRPWGKLSTGGWICLTYTDYVVHTVVDDNASNSVTVKVTSGPLNVRSGAGTSYPLQKTLSVGTSVTIVSTQTVSGTTWGKLSSGGWICLSYTNYTANTPSGNTGVSDGTMATVSTSGGLNVRSGANAGASIVGSYPYGTQVKILEQKTVSGVVWGRTVDGWINMSYVKTATGGTTSTAKTYTVTGDSVNVRNGAGTSHAIVNVMNKGARVVIVSTKTDGSGTTWGQISGGGWISMNYVA